MGARPHRSCLGRGLVQEILGRWCSARLSVALTAERGPRATRRRVEKRAAPGPVRVRWRHGVVGGRAVSGTHALTSGGAGWRSFVDLSLYAAPPCPLFHFCSVRLVSSLTSRRSMDLVVSARPMETGWSRFGKSEKAVGEKTMG